MGQSLAQLEGTMAEPRALDLLEGPLLGAPLLVLCTLAVARGAHRWARRLTAAGRGAETPTDALSRRWLFTLVVAFAFVATSCALLASLGGLSRTGVALASLLFAVTCPKRDDTAGPELGRAWRFVRDAGLTLPCWLIGLLIVLDLALHLPIVPSNWDGMGYHLYFAARWLQAGFLEAVPTVFGDPSHTHAPHNGALIFAWQMALLGRDTTTNVSQLAALALLALALFRLARRTGSSCHAAVLAASLPFWLEPLRRWTYSANVDVFLIAFGVAAIALLLDYQQTGRWHDLLAAGLAGGLAAGTKILGLPLAGVPGLAATLLLLGHRRFAHLGLYLGSAVAAGGWWTLRNTWRTGNPVFPLHLELGPLELGGAYDGAALRASEFQIGDLGALLETTWQRLGAPTLLLAALGVILLLAIARRRDPRRPALLLAAAALGWWFYFLLAIPHNNQSRFALPAVALALAGLGSLFDFLRHRWGRHTATISWLAVVLVCALDAAPWDAGQETLAVFETAEASAFLWLALLALTLVLATIGYRRRSLASATTAVALVMTLLLVAASYAEAGRPRTLAAEDYRAWAPGYLPLLEDSLPPLRIAYSGTSVPYVLMAGGWRHHVRYVNIQGGPTDGFFEFWRRDRRLHASYKPPIYRGAGSREVWLAHLEHHQIDLVAIFALHPVDRLSIASTSDGFPIEARWARETPDRFVPLLADPAAEIYALRPAVEQP